MSYTAEEFLAIIKPMVIKYMKSNKILASLTAAQALIESNKGNSGLTQKANNLFGMKGMYEGHCVTMPTTEYYNGIKTTVDAQFRKYPSWQDSIDDHSGLFWRSVRYTNLRGCTDYKLACINVQKDGYATSPTYSQTLIKTIEKYKLYEWDREILGTVPVDDKPKTGNPYPEPTKNIRYNSKGNDARWLQYELNRYGYKLLVDGIIGQRSLDALKDFQLTHGLEPDGICGPKTKQALLG
jgi:peptidoglycan hydrolase-like protein with peptidoglycan-binding domain